MKVLYNEQTCSITQLIIEQLKERHEGILSKEGIECSEVRLAAERKREEIAGKMREIKKQYRKVQRDLANKDSLLYQMTDVTNFRKILPKLSVAIE